MRKQSVIIFFILLILFGCDFNKQVKKTIDKEVKAAKAEMNKDIDIAKLNFKKLHEKALKQSTDSIFSSKITSLYVNIFMTSKYIDSLRTEISLLDDMDLNNIELLERKFLDGGIADSIFNKVKHSYSLSIDIALADTTKARLKKITETYSEETKKQFFEMNSPLGLIMILYGIESELIKNGTRSLNAHVNL